MKVLQTLVGVWKELQRFVMHKSAGTPAGMPEGGYYYDTVKHAPMYHDGTSVRPFGVTEHDKLEGLTEGDPHPQYVLGTEIGVSNGVASLDASGKVPAAQLPAFVDDVLEYASLSAFPATGESGTLYHALDTSMLYRWTGSTYAQIAPGGASLVLGETSSTAYRGDRGAQAYAHALQSGNPHGTTIVDVSGLKAALDGKMDAASNPDLVAIEALAGTAGLLKKTAANTWVLDTSTYATTSKLSDGSVTKVGTASVGSGTQPIFLNAGVPTASTATIGSASLPTYSNAGVITACGTTLGVSVTGNAATATKLGTASVGSTSQPIYLNAGTPTAITGTIANSTSGNAGTATKLATARTIALSGDVDGSASFDGSANVTINTVSDHFGANTGTYAPWQVKGTKNGYAGISMPGIHRVDVMSHTTENYAGIYDETDSKWMLLKNPENKVVTEYPPASSSNSNELATTAFVNAKISKNEFNLYNNSGALSLYASRLCAWTPAGGATYSITLEFNFAGGDFPWENKPFTAVITYRDNNFNVHYTKCGTHDGLSRIYCGLNGSTAEIWVCSFGQYMRFKGRVVSSTHEEMYNPTGTIVSTIPSYMTDFGRPAIHADTLDGYHLAIQPLSATRTAPNTVFYCY